MAHASKLNLCQAHFFLTLTLQRPELPHRQRVTSFAGRAKKFRGSRRSGSAGRMGRVRWHRCGGPVWTRQMKPKRSQSQAARFSWKRSQGAIFSQHGVHALVSAALQAGAGAARSGAPPPAGHMFRAGEGMVHGAWAIPRVGRCWQHSMLKGAGWSEGLEQNWFTGGLGTQRPILLRAPCQIGCRRPICGVRGLSSISELGQG